MKVALNKCFGGFRISKEVAIILKEKGVEVKFKGDKYKDGSKASQFYGFLSNEDFGIESKNYEEYRADKRLIEAIERVGEDKASGRCAELKIVKIPDNIKWFIDEYDGIETLREKHRFW